MQELAMIMAVIWGIVQQQGNIKMAVTGDVMPGRTVNVSLRKSGDFNYPFAKMGILKTADISMINLESPVIRDCMVRMDGFKFCSDERIVPALAEAGVDVVNVANNHIGNEGRTGIEQTLELVDQAGMKVTGVEDDSIIEVKGKKFGFLGFNAVGGTPDGILAAEDKIIITKIRELKEKVDFVVVQFHWGNEYTNRPNSKQRELAHLAIEAGAELVVGNHAHWVQGIERYQGKLIAYSHGNFLFDQQWSAETQEGVVGVYEFGKTGLVSHEFLPIVVDKTFQPYFAEGERKVKILKRIEAGSIQ